MKFVSTLLVASSVASVSAFVASPSSSARLASSKLFSTVRPDASQAIQAALEASKKYGATSPEARVAWDAVEEMDASDNRYVCVVLI